MNEPWLRHPQHRVRLMRLLAVYLIWHLFESALRLWDRTAGSSTLLKLIEKEKSFDTLSDVFMIGEMFIFAYGLWVLLSIGRDSAKRTEDDFRERREVASQERLGEDNP